MMAGDFVSRRPTYTVKRDGVLTMKKGERKSDQPLGLVGVLFALSIGFWGHAITTYFVDGPSGLLPQVIAERVAPSPDEELDYNLGIAAYNRGNAARAKKETVSAKIHYEEAIDYYQAAINENARYAAAHFALGKVYLEQKEQLAKRVVSYENWIKTHPGYAEAHYVLGNLQWERNKLLGNQQGKQDEQKEAQKEAIGQYREAIALKPGFSDAHKKFFFVLLDIEDWDWKRLKEAAGSTFLKINVVWMLTLIAGLVFLADIVCILWWYAMYIYKIQTTATIVTYFLDFSVCAMFNVAANKWTVPAVFLWAVVLAVTFLLVRFKLLYDSHEANDTDRRILRAAARGLGAAALISLAALGLLPIVFPSTIQPFLFSEFLHPVAVIVLSGIGIRLTFKFRDKIRVSSEIHEAGSVPFVPMDLHWPAALANDSESQFRITDGTRQGLSEFRGLFAAGPTEVAYDRARKGLGPLRRLLSRGPAELAHDRLLSRVHSEGDLTVQSYILAIPSWRPEKSEKIGGSEAATVYSNEVTNKALMVGVSHWLDDLVDGRGEVELRRRLQREDKFGLEIDGAKAIFDRIYGDIILNHTDEKVYANIVDKITKAAPLPDNQKYLFFSLNRVAVGAVIFSPKVKVGDRRKFLESHNSTLVKMIEDEGRERGEMGRGSSEWYVKLEKLIVGMRTHPSELGKQLLGLTTKTVQEMAMASESDKVCFAQSVLYSLLYAPLLYFHDIDNEVAYSELVPLETFDVEFYTTLPWLSEIRMLIEDPDAPKDSRMGPRLEQLRMAFQCFIPNLPELPRRALKEIYDPPEKGLKVVQKAG